MYSLDNPDQILVRLKVEHSGLCTLNNQMFGSKFVEDDSNSYNSELRWMT